MFIPEVEVWDRSSGSRLRIQNTAFNLEEFIEEVGANGSSKV